MLEGRAIGQLLHRWVTLFHPDLSSDVRNHLHDLHHAHAFLDMAMFCVPHFHTLHLSEWDAPFLRAKGPWTATLTRRTPTSPTPLYVDQTTQIAHKTQCLHATTPALAVFVTVINTEVYARTPY